MSQVEKAEALLKADRRLKHAKEDIAKFKKSKQQSFQVKMWDGEISHWYINVTRNAVVRGLRAELKAANEEFDKAMAAMGTV